MLKVKQMQEIQDLKLRGYSKNEIVSYYESQGKKPPSRPTLNKCSENLKGLATFRIFPKGVSPSLK